MEKRPKVVRVTCRHYEGALTLPCNYVKEGFCGIDACRCNIVILGEA